jgi:2-haloacid dehalogenase
MLEVPHMNQYKHYFFDLDDTLLDFKASERLSFDSMLEALNLTALKVELYETYQLENQNLWHQLERGEVSKDQLKTLRFERTFRPFQLSVDPERASDLYLEALPESVVLMDHAVDTLKALAAHAEIGIITNGIESVQHRRIERSPLKDYLSFVCVSEKCGYAKPDVRFFEYTANHATNFKKEQTLVVGDRYNADIIGAHAFGVDSCWLNTHGAKVANPVHRYEITSLKEFFHGP